MESQAPRPNRLLYIGLGVVALVVYFLTRPRQPAPLAPESATVAPAATTATVAPTAPAVTAAQTAQVSPAKANSPVSIQDGKTIDFSSGRPVVKDSSSDKAIIDAAVKEMEEAGKGVTFGPTKK